MSFPKLIIRTGSLTLVPGYWTVAEIAVATQKSNQSVQNAITGYRSALSGREVLPKLGAWKAGRPWMVPDDEAIKYIASQTLLEPALSRVAHYNQGHQIYSLSITPVVN